MANSFDCVVLGGNATAALAATLVARAGFCTLLAGSETSVHDHLIASLAPGSLRGLSAGLALEPLDARLNPQNVGLRAARPDDTLANFWRFPLADSTTAAAAAGVPQLLQRRLNRLLRATAVAADAQWLSVEPTATILNDDGRLAGVRLQMLNGDDADYSCRAVIDCREQPACGLAVLEENAPREIASTVPNELLWGLYRRGERPGGPDAGATQVFSSRTAGVWLWYVPLADDLVSVGMASSAGVLSSGAMAAVWEEQLTQCPAVLDRLVDAELTHHLHWMRRPASVAVDPVGTGCVLAGEALFTAGPPFFPVTHWSLESARLAAADVISSLQQPAGQHIQPSLPSGAWVKPFLGGIRAGYALAAAMYNPAWDFTNQARISVECRAAIMKTLAGRWDHPSQSTLPRLLEPDAGTMPLIDRMRTVK